MTDTTSPTTSPASSAGAPATGAMLRLTDVSISYGKTTVVDSVSLELAAGEWLAVIGPNGAGKSTVLKAIAGVLPFDGTIEVDGAAHRTRTVAPRTVGYVPQQPALPLGMTTAEYVLLGRTAHLRWLQSESATDRAKVTEVLEQLDLGSLAHRPITELSGGEAQRATLARVLVQEATILVLDEPTSALDLAHQIAVLELVDDLRSDHDLTVVTAVHDLTIASRFADRLALVADGKAVAIGTPAEVLTEDVLTHYYRTPVTVSPGPDGGVVVIPLRNRASKGNEQP